jgi:SAM-dependent methyltransferase
MTARNPTRQAVLPGACPLCGSTAATPAIGGTDRLFAMTTRRFELVRCRGCGLLRQSPMPAAGEIAAFYPETYWFAADGTMAGRLEEAYRRVVLRDHVRFVRAALESVDNRAPVLDVGCGGGLFLHMIAEGGRRVVGLDRSATAARVALRAQGVPSVSSVLDAAPFTDATFGAITMFHVLEHLADPAAYVRAAYRLLKPGGRLVVQVPNIDSLQSRLFGSRWSGFELPRHLVGFGVGTLRRLLEQEHFEVLRTKYFSLRDNPAGCATSLLPSLDPTSRRVRQRDRSPGSRLAKDLVYLGLTALAVPFALFEAACRAGSSVMIDSARR